MFFPSITVRFERFLLYVMPCSSRHRLDNLLRVLCYIGENNSNNRQVLAIDVHHMVRYQFSEESDAREHTTSTPLIVTGTRQ